MARFFKSKYSGQQIEDVLDKVYNSGLSPAVLLTNYTFGNSDWSGDTAPYTITHNTNTYFYSVQTTDTNGKSICLGVEFLNGNTTIRYTSSEKIAFYAHCVLQKGE